MHISRFIIGYALALVALFAVGCSKKVPDPIVSFKGYTVRSGGVTQATFEFKNPSQSMMACLLETPTSDSSMILAIKAGCYTTATINVTDTNLAFLRVTVMRLTPTHKFTESIP